MRFLLFIAIFALSVNALERVSLQLNWKYQFEFAGFIAAKEKGFYEEVGLDVELLEYRADIDIAQEVLSQRVNYGVSNSNIILDRGSISPVVLLATYLQKSPLVLVTKPNIKNPLDLVGKNIMGAKDELKYSSLALLLEHFNINNSNSNIIPQTFNIDDFANSKVDAMSAFKSNQIYELDRRKIAYNIIDPADYGFIVSGINLYSSIKEAKDNYDYESFDIKEQELIKEAFLLAKFIQKICISDDLTEDVVVKFNNIISNIEESV